MTAALFASRPTHADPRVLELEAVVAADERDVRIVLDRDVLEADEPERLPHERRLGRVAGLGHPLLGLEHVARRLVYLRTAFGGAARRASPTAGAPSCWTVARGSPSAAMPLFAAGSSPEPSARAETGMASAATKTTARSMGS